MLKTEENEVVKLRGFVIFTITGPEDETIRYARRVEDIVGVDMPLGDNPDQRVEVLIRNGELPVIKCKVNNSFDDIMDSIAHALGDTKFDIIDDLALEGR